MEQKKDKARRKKKNAAILLNWKSRENVDEIFISVKDPGLKSEYTFSTQYK